MPRFTGTKFDNLIVKVADGNRLSAKISSTGNTTKAHVTWKDGRAQVEEFFTFFSEASMRENLKKLDASVKFFDKQVTRETEASTRNEQDSVLLEAMRVDSGVNDQAYRNACRKFGVAPSPRPDHSGTKEAQAITPLYKVITQFEAFKKAHPDLGYGVFIEYNLNLISQWCENENKELTTPNLEQAYAELDAAHCFKRFDTGRPGGRITQVYDHAALVAARKSRSVVIAPPENLSPVDHQAWERAHALNPHLDVRSEKFRITCAQQVWSWARTNAFKEGFTEENVGELNKRCEEIVLAWSRQSNPNLGQGNKSAVDRRVYLG